MPRLVAPRNRKKLTEEEKQVRALAAVKETLGEESFEGLRKQWLVLRDSKLKADKKKADGLIVCLLQQNVSQRQIKALFPKLGTSRILRIRKVMDNPELAKKPRPPPSHALTPSQKEAIKTHISEFDTEDGFPCSHRRARTYFTQEGLT